MLRLLWILPLLPLADLLLTAFLLGHYGTSFLLWLLAGVLLGGLLIARAKSGLRGIFATLQSGQVQVAGNALWRLLGTARAFIAGALLVFPGVLTDALALVVLLLPGRVLGGRAAGPQAANDDVIEGEFHEVRETRSSVEDMREDKRAP